MHTLLLQKVDFKGLIKMFLCLYVLNECVCRSLWRPEVGVRCPAARLTGSYVPSNVSSGNQNLALWSSNMQS